MLQMHAVFYSLNDFSGFASSLLDNITVHYLKYISQLRFALAKNEFEWKST